MIPEHIVMHMRYIKTQKYTKALNKTDNHTQHVHLLKHIRLMITLIRALDRISKQYSNINI